MRQRLTGWASCLWLVFATAAHVPCEQGGYQRDVSTYRGDRLAASLATRVISEKLTSNKRTFGKPALEPPSDPRLAAALRGPSPEPTALSSKSTKFAASSPWGVGLGKPSPKAILRSNNATRSSRKSAEMPDGRGLDREFASSTVARDDMQTHVGTSVAQRSLAATARLQSKACAIGAKIFCDRKRKRHALHNALNLLKSGARVVRKLERSACRATKRAQHISKSGGSALTQIAEATHIWSLANRARAKFEAEVGRARQMVNNFEISKAKKSSDHANSVVLDTKGTQQSVRFSLTKMKRKERLLKREWKMLSEAIARVADAADVSKSLYLSTRRDIAAAIANQPKKRASSAASAQQQNHKGATSHGKLSIARVASSASSSAWREKASPLAKHSITLKGHDMHQKKIASSKRRMVQQSKGLLDAKTHQNIERTKKRQTQRDQEMHEKQDYVIAKTTPVEKQKAHERRWQDISKAKKQAAMRSMVQKRDRKQKRTKRKTKKRDSQKTKHRESKSLKKLSLSAKMTSISNANATSVERVRGIGEAANALLRASTARELKRANETLRLALDGSGSRRRRRNTGSDGSLTSRRGRLTTARDHGPSFGDVAVGKGAMARKRSFGTGRKAKHVYHRNRQDADKSPNKGATRLRDALAAEKKVARAEKSMTKASTRFNKLFSKQSGKGKKHDATAAVLAAVRRLRDAVAG
eukprot:TRINITY_DN63929_c0_g1_i1.p1 TRINITY_DN63929_c0_g1~~TRINITY_DN63929_c0_g1_i1.p1  ORF type:complete len:702 (-),score=105.90 TRINITY_DN63929_c0_g1_i1:126-2231(-)